MINDLQLMKNFKGLYEKNIILYGASKKGKDIYNSLIKLGVNGIKGFCDSSKSKWGGEFLGYKVFSVKELVELSKEDKELIIIITSMYVDEINNMLEILEIATPIYSYAAIEIGIILNIDNPAIIDRINSEYREDVKLYKKLKAQYRLGYAHGRAYQEMLALYERNPIFIYQMGKVGSCTIHHSLGLKGKDFSHIHFLGDYVKQQYGIEDLTFNHKECEELIKRVFKIYNGEKKLKIVTLVREPIGRQISFFFEAMLELSYLGQIGYDLKESFWKMDKIWNDTGLKGFKWFDEELKKWTGIDVYQYSFNQELGYSIIKKDNIEVLVIKLEKLNTLEEVIGEFCEVPDFKLVNYNESKDKGYRYMYEQFKKEIKLPKQYIDELYSDKYMSYFYSKEEQRIFLNKWESNVIN